MIKINELRYFNLIRRNNQLSITEYFQVEKVDWSILKDLEEDEYDFNEKYSPIILDHFWLKKLHFEASITDKSIFSNDIVEIQERTIENDSELRFYYNHKRIMYVHELQNLFFALTGIELQIIIL